MKINSFIKIALILPAAAIMYSCSNSIGKSLETRMQQLSESADFGAVEYTVKKVVKANDVGEWYKVGDRKILFSTTAYLKAGIDLSALSMDNVDMQKSTKSIIVTLPHAKLLSINMPAEETVLVYDQVSFFRSSFTAEERNALLKQGEEDIVADITNLGILEDAENNASDFFTAMLYQLGFENVTIKFDDGEEQL